MPQILVSTGSPFVSATKTEIINIENNGLTCKDLEEYPLQVSGAVGSNMGSSPVICGGSISWTSLNQCHRLESGKWQNFANLTQAYVYCIYYIRFALILPFYIFALVCKLYYQNLIIFTS